MLLTGPETRGAHREALEYDRRYYLLLVPEAMLALYVALKKRVCALLRFRPRYNSWWYDRLPSCRAIRVSAERGQTALSLNVVYNHTHLEHASADRFSRILEAMWMRMPSAQAVRNRMRIVTELLEAEVRRAHARSGGQVVNVAFLAGGFVQTGVTVARRVSGEGIRLNCIVLDISRKALDRARRRAEAAEVGSAFSFVRTNVLDPTQVRKSLAGIDVSVIEMIGILDYLGRRDAVRLLQLARQHLEPGGLLLTGNILWTCWEAPFLYSVINWPRMKHRRAQPFTRILDESGFAVDADHLQMHVEPHRVFMVCEARNRPQRDAPGADATGAPLIDGASVPATA